MGVGVVIAIASIIQILLSFSPILYVLFPDLANSSYAVGFYILITLLSIFITFFIIFLIFIDKETPVQKKIIGAVLAFFLSGFGALIYLFIRSANLKITENVSESRHSNKVLFSGNFTPKGRIVDLINSPSFSKVSESDKRMILDMERNTDRVQGKEWQNSDKEDSSVAYYKNGKPVYKKK